jgi:hypothetical protein
MVSAEIIQTQKGPRVLLIIDGEHRTMEIEEAHEYADKDDAHYGKMLDCPGCLILDACEGIR